MTNQIEKKLMKDLSEGDETAFSVLHIRHRGMLLKRVIENKFTREEAEDIVQDTFEALWETRHNLKDVKNIGGYLYTMARNKCAEHYNKKKRSKELYKGLREISGHTAPDFEMNEGALEELLRAIDQIKQPARRRIAYLIFFKNYTDSAVAAEMGTTVQHIRNQKSFCKKLLISVLKK